MSRRVYTPRSRPTRGANIRVGYCELVEHHDRPVGSANLQKFSIDACGAVSARRVTYGTPGDIARSNSWGRDRTSVSYDDRADVGDWGGPGGGGYTPVPPTPPEPPIVDGPGMMGLTGPFAASTIYPGGADQTGDIIITNVSTGTFSAPTWSVSGYSGSASGWLSMSMGGAAPPYTASWTASATGLAAVEMLSATITFTSAGAAPTTIAQNFTFDITEPLMMSFSSFAPNVITPGDAVAVSGLNLDAMIAVQLEPYVWTDGFGKRHMIIDGVEYVEI